MDSYAISKVRTRYIVPFEFKQDEINFEEICHKVDNYRDYPYSFLKQKNDFLACKWERVSLRQGEQDVYGYVLDEFSVPGEIDYSGKIEKAGCYWNYNSFKETPFHIKFSLDKKIDDNTKFYDISIIDMGLYIFRNGIGFLWYEISIDLDQMRESAQFIQFQNMFKELDRGYNNHLWIDSARLNLPEEWKDKKVIPFMLGNWIAERLEFLDIKYQAERNNSYASLLGEYFYEKLPKGEKNEKISRLYKTLLKNCPDKALLFTYAVFERPEDWEINDNTIQTVYYLTNGYKESYEMSQEIRDIIRTPFSNVIWMATREGCGYFVWQGEKNGTFFTKNQYVKIMNDYFLLYIRTIYQSFSLMRYTVLASKLLPNDFNTYLQVSEQTEDLSDKISRIGAEISLFLVKSIATSVSHIQHQNEFYGYLNERLQIKEDASSVTAGLSALNELQMETAHKKQKQIDEIRREEHEKEEQREKEADNTFQVGLGLMTFLAVISAITDAYGIIDGLANSTLSCPWMIGFVALFIICIGILIASITIFVKSVRNLMGKRK